MVRGKRYIPLMTPRFTSANSIVSALKRIWRGLLSFGVRRGKPSQQATRTNARDANIMLNVTDSFQVRLFYSGNYHGDRHSWRSDIAVAQKGALNRDQKQLNISLSFSLSQMCYCELLALGRECSKRSSYLESACSCFQRKPGLPLSVESCVCWAL